MALLALGLIAVVGALALLLGGSGDQGHARAQGSQGAGRHSGHEACDRALGSTGALGSAAADADPGTVICLRNGSYGKLALKATGSGEDITIRAEHPGKASISGATLRGSHLALADFDVQ